MGYSWTQLPVQAGEKIKSSQILEIRDKANLIRNEVGLGNYVWTKIITEKINIGTNELFELRNAIDEAYNANICTSNNMTHLSSDRNDHNQNYESSHNVSNLITHDSGYYNNVETGHLANNNITFYSNHENTYKQSHQNFINNTNYETVQTNHNTTIQTLAYTDNCNRDNNIVCFKI